ncbi:MAG: winged helix-turn-helix transcriptional regulator [Actinomycetota bacterium]
MKRKGFAHIDSDLARALDLLGERWTLLIVQTIRDGHVRFEALREELGIARNILASRLEDLVGAGVIERRAYTERPPRDEYHLTESGHDLSLSLDHLAQWGKKWN